MSVENLEKFKNFEEEMGEFTKLAYSRIKNDLFSMNAELDSDDALDELDNGNNFKKLSDVLMEIMVEKGIPKDTETRIGKQTIADYLKFVETNENTTIKLHTEDSPELFIRPLYTLLNKQEKECSEDLRRKTEWRDEKIAEWLVDKPRTQFDKKESNTSQSIRSKEDAISICFALGLDYSETQEFFNKIGMTVLNIRNAEDAVYIYCLMKHRPLSVARKLIELYEENYKKLSDIIKEAMIDIGIPKDTESRLKDDETVCDYLRFVRLNEDNGIKLCKDDKSELFCKALFELLIKQNAECPDGYRRKNPWKEGLVEKWINEQDNKFDIIDYHANNSLILRSDAIAVCFALGMDYDDAQKFLDEIGMEELNNGNPEEAIYIKCLRNHESFSTAKDLIKSRNKKLRKETDANEIQEYSSMSTSGNTTVTMKNDLFDLSNWDTDESFLNTFLIPKRKLFIDYSKTALKEYYKLKIPIYLYTLRDQLEAESDNYKEFRRQQYLNTKPKWRLKEEGYKDLKQYTMVSRRFVSRLKIYSSELILFKRVNNIAKQNVNLKNRNGEPTSDNFINLNPTKEAFDYLIENINIYTLNDIELTKISNFLSEVVTARVMLQKWLPSVADSDEDGTEYVDADGNNKIKDSRTRKYSDSILSSSYNVEKNDKIQHNDNSNLFLDSFTNRQFFTKYENNPANGDLSRIAIRKTIILLYYLNYAYASTGKLSSLDNMGEFELGFENFIVNLNNILGKCQLGKLYLANQYDWLILKSVVYLDTHPNEYDEDSLPSQFLDDILESSFSESYLDSDDVVE